jgi:uncharacterized membrane protein
MIGAPDYEFHYLRTIGIVDALKDGQILPQLSPDAFYGFGYAFSEFYGPVPTYLALFLRLVLGNWILAFHFTCFLAVLFSALLFYSLVRKIAKSKKSESCFSGLFGTIIFLNSITILSDIYFQQLFGVLFASCGSILIFNGLYQIFYREQNYTTNSAKPLGQIISISLGAFLCITSHNITTIITIVVCLIFLSLHITKITIPILKQLGISAVFAVGLSAFFIFPLLENIKTGLYNVTNSVYKRNFFQNSNDAMNSYRRSLTDILHPPPIASIS